MRFDDSVFRLLGHELIGLTSERELLVNSDTYRQRNAHSMRLPGAVVREMAFTLSRARTLPDQVRTYPRGHIGRSRCTPRPTARSGCGDPGRTRRGSAMAGASRRTS